MTTARVVRQNYEDLHNRFPFIRPYCKRMGSYDYYMCLELERAAACNAPGDVVKVEGELWTLRDLRNKDTIEYLLAA